MQRLMSITNTPFLWTWQLITLVAVASLTVTGCGATVSAIPAQITLNSRVVPSQSTAKAGAVITFSATEHGLTLKGGTWSVLGGKAYGTIDSSGTYVAPVSVTSDTTVVVSYTYLGTTLAGTITLLSSAPIIRAIAPNLVTSMSTPFVITGDGFTAGSTILVNSTPIATTLVDATHLSGTLILPSAANSRTRIAVRNPAPTPLTSAVFPLDAVFGASPYLGTASTYAEQSDDFVGPFPSWVNVKAKYGAVGDGIADDTAALQRAFDSLGDASSSCVIWLPAGTYNISRTLLLTHKRNFSIVGEDPRTTLIKWAGAPSDMMLSTDASTYFRLARFSLDGNGLVEIAENVSTLTTSPGGYYSTYNEISDQRLKGTKVGIHLGDDSETVLSRIVYDHLPTTGVSVGNFNTLNIFVDDSLFLNCGTGLTDTYKDGAGSFIVRNSVFVNSQVADMTIANTGLFTARHNVSVGSRAFFVSYELYGNSSMVTLQNNTILDPTTAPFQFGNLGPFMLIDNTVRLQNSSLPIIQGSWTQDYQKDVFSMGNRYTPNAGVITSGNPTFQGRLVSYDDTIVPVGSIPSVNVPTGVYTPPNNHSSVFEVSDRTGAAIQLAIDTAVKSEATRAVVHLPKGTYRVSQCLTFPTNSDIELIGDDVTATELDWVGSSTSTCMINIPTSNVSVKYLKLYGNISGDAIVAKVADEPSTQIIVDQLGAVGGNTVGISFEGLEHATAELLSSYVYGTDTGVRATAGAFRAAKEGTLGLTNFYSGSLQSTGNATSFDVAGGGKLMVQDNWHDLNLSSPQNFKLSGSGTVTEQGGAVFMNSSKPFEIDNFDGNVSLLGLLFAGGFQLSPLEKHTNLLTLGLVGQTSPYLPSSAGNAMVQNILDSNQGAHIAKQDNPSAAWLRTMLAQTRTEYPIRKVTLAPGATRIRISRVSVLSNKAGLRVVPDAVKSGLFYTLSSGTSVLANTIGACVSTYGTTANDQWLLMAAGEGDFEIVSRSSGFALGYATSSDQTVTLGPLTGLYDQRWLVEPVGDGSFLLRNRQSNSLLSPVPGGCVALSTTSYTGWTITSH